MQLWLDAWADAVRRPGLQETSRRLNREVAAPSSRGSSPTGRLRQHAAIDPDAAAWRLLR